MSSKVKILVGTTKGMFLLESDDGRTTWQQYGPYCDLWSINHAIGDPETGTIWAAGGNSWSGAGVWKSSDGGDSWSLSNSPTERPTSGLKPNPKWPNSWA